MKKSIIIIFLILLISNLLSLISTSLVLAGPQSSTYELKEFGFGAGGEASISSNTYSMFGTAGEIDAASTESTTYRNNPGLIFTMQANVPPAPTFANPSNNYDRLKIILNIGNNPSDAQFAIAVTSALWNGDKYVQNDNTIGDVLGNEDWQTFANWGDTGGFYLTGLTNDTIYTIKVKARQGIYTETSWGPTVSQTTDIPSLTFGIDSATVTFNNLNSGNNFTDSSKSTLVTTSTNAYNGYIIYGHDTNALDAANIPNYASSNSSPSTWTNIGFGYTTSDNNVTGGTPDRFTNGGPKYAGFQTSAPGDPVADHAGPILTPINSENFTISYRVTAENTTLAGNYKTTVLYIVVPTY